MMSFGLAEILFVAGAAWPLFLPNNKRTQSLECVTDCDLVLADRRKHDQAL